MHWNLTGLVAALLVSSAAVPAHPSRPGPTGPPVAQQTGTIEGVLRLPLRAPRRTVNRYGAAPVVAQVQEIPAVVYLRGRIGPPPAPAMDAVMAQHDTAFVPSLLVIPVGTTVRFPNQDPFFHNVFSYSVGGRFDLGRYPMGQSKEVTFDEPGIVKVYCEVHESMRAAIVVTENRWWARPDEDGRFRLEGVPAGTYTLVAWQADRGEVEQEVLVPADGVVRVELEL